MSKEIRKYFESAEEMHKAFIEGKKIYWKSYERDIKPKYYQIKDGIICSFDAFNDKMLGIAHGAFSDCTGYFTSEKPVFKIEVGRFYRNKNDDKVICVFYNPEISGIRKYKMSIIDKNRNYYVDKEGDACLELEDIVDYWEE